MAVLQDYADFIIEYAPYFYYTPGEGVDPVWGKGPAAAAHSIDFLVLCHADSRFASMQSTIYDKIVELADFLVSIQCTNNTKKAYGGFQSKEGSDYYYSIDAHRSIPALLKAYDLTANVDYYNAAVLAGDYLYTMQHPPVPSVHDQYYGGFAQFVNIGDQWGANMWVVDLYGIVGLKELYTRTGDAKYQTILDEALAFYRQGIIDLWLYYTPPPSGNGAWHRAPGTPPENLIYDDDFSYALHSLYQYEGWSETVEKVFRHCSEIEPTIDHPAYQPAVGWPGYLDVINRKPDCDYYDAVTSGILALVLRKNHDGIMYEYAKKIIERHPDSFMYWGPQFSDYSPVEDKKATVTVSWLGMYLIEYSPISNKFTQILNAHGETVTFYSVISGETESFAEGIEIKAIVRSTESKEIFLEAGYTVDDYKTFYVFSPVRHHDKLVHKSIPYTAIGVQDFNFQKGTLYLKVLCRRLLE